MIGAPLVRVVPMPIHDYRQLVKVVEMGKPHGQCPLGLPRQNRRVQAMGPVPNVGMAEVLGAVRKKHLS